jgi:hypothetical protein
MRAALGARVAQADEELEGSQGSEPFFAKKGDRWEQCGLPHPNPSIPFFREKGL